MSCERIERALAAGPPPTEPELLEHVESCEGCRALFVARGLLGPKAPTGPSAPRRDCPSSEELLEWMRGSLAEHLRGRLLRHTADCEACTAEVVALGRDLERIESATLDRPSDTLERQAVALTSGTRFTERTVRRSSRTIWPTLAAAAGLVFVAFGLGLLVFDRRPSIDPSAPAGSFRNAAAVAIVSSGPQGAMAARDELVFSWTDPTMIADGEDGPRRYRLLILDLSDGATIIDTTVGDLSYRMPGASRARLVHGRTYHWLVEPIGPSSALPSPPTPFRIEP